GSGLCRTAPAAAAAGGLCRTAPKALLGAEALRFSGSLLGRLLALSPAPPKEASMRPLLPGLAVCALLGGCAVHPDGTIGPLPPAPPPGVVVAPPVHAVPYAPPAYGYGQPGVPVYVVPQPVPPPVVVSPS